MVRRKTNGEFMAEVKEIVGDEYTFLEPYETSRTKILVRHEKCGYEYRVSPNMFISNGNRCAKCRKVYRRTHDDFVEEVRNSREGCEYEVTGTYVNAVTKIDLLHKVCGHNYQVTPASFLCLGTRCTRCSGYYSPTTEEFNEKIKSLVGNEYEFHGEYLNSTTRMAVTHNICGRVYTTTPALFTNAGVRCTHCYISSGEADIESALKRLGVKYEREKTFEELGRLRFDFFLPEYEYCIEFDGEQHYKPVDYWGGKSNYQKIVARDSLKEEFCDHSGFGLLRIPWINQKYIDLIINRLIKNLNSNTYEILDFVDWKNEMETI